MLTTPIARSLLRSLPVAAVLLLGSPLAAQLLGSPFGIGFVGGTTAETPAVAYDRVHARYLVVWSAPTGATTAEIRAQYVSADGSLLTFPIVVEADADRFVPPVVCNVSHTHRFVVGYRRNATTGIIPVTDTNWYVRTLYPPTSISNRVLVPFNPATTGAIAELALGGDARSDLFNPATRALLVVQRTGTIVGAGSIAFAMVDTTTTDPTVGTFTTLTSPGLPVGDIAVTANTGSLNSGVGRWLVTWCQSATLGPFVSVRGHLVDTDGNACGSPATLHSGFVTVANPTVAARSVEDFAVAWEQGSDIRVRPVTFTGSCGAIAMTLGTTVDPVSGSNNSEPALTMTLDKYLLTWRHTPSPFPSAVFVKGLDRDACIACSQEWALEYQSDAQRAPVLCSRATAGDIPSDDALVVWSVDDLRGRRFEAVGTDLVVNLGGGCTDSGIANVASSVGEFTLGNRNFQFVLATPTVPALALILGFSAINAPCGSCTVGPSLDILLPGVTPTTFELPCDPLLIGVNIWSQWLLLKPSDCPLLPDFAVTNTLRFTIGE